VLEFPLVRPILLLASASLRRRQLLSLIGMPFETLSANVDETPRSGEEEIPDVYVLRLAETKARAARSQADGQSVIVAADTTVVDGQVLLGKPADRSEANRMLRRLRGRVHQVYTGIAVLRVEEDRLVSDVCVTDVSMRWYSDEEIEAYVASGDPLDKAGAYAIQHAGFRPVARLSGCYAGVMGLPLCYLTRLLLAMGIVPPADVPSACQSFLEYECPVYRQILAQAPRP